jgi:hypothetical protein
LLADGISGVQIGPRRYGVGANALLGEKLDEAAVKFWIATLGVA